LTEGVAGFSVIDMATESDAPQTNSELDLALAATAKLSFRSTKRTSRECSSFLRARRSEPADAEDITARVFIKATEALPSSKQKRSPFAAWLFCIPHNELAHFYKTWPRRHETPLEEAVVASTDSTEVALGQSSFSEDSGGGRGRS
jgi:hypothetical protein